MGSNFWNYLGNSVADAGRRSAVTYDTMAVQDQRRAAERMQWAREDRARQETDRQREVRALQAVAGAVQPVERSETLPGNVKFSLDQAGAAENLAPPDTGASPFYFPSVRNYTAEPTEAEALRRLAQAQLPPEDYAAAFLNLPKNLPREAVAPRAVQQEIADRRAAIGMAPGATAEEVARGGGGAPRYDPLYQTREAFRRSVSQGVYGDPNTAEGRLTIANKARELGLDDVAAGYEKGAANLKAIQAERQAKARMEAVPGVTKRVDDLLAGAGNRLTPEEKAGIGGARDAYAADPTPQSLAAVNRAIESANKQVQARKALQVRVEQFDKRLAAVKGAKEAKTKEAMALKLASEIRQRVTQIDRELASTFDPMAKVTLMDERDRLVAQYEEVRATVSESVGAGSSEAEAPPPKERGPAPSGASSLDRYFKK